MNRKRNISGFGKRLVRAAVIAGAVAVLQSGSAGAMTAENYRMYDEYLSRVYQGLTEHTGIADMAAIGFGQFDFSLTHVSYDNAYYNIDEFGYLFRDLDGDGTEELLIGPAETSAAGSVYELITIADGKLTYVIPNCGARWRYYLCTGNVLQYDWSGGAAYSGWEYYRYADAKLTLIEQVMYDYMTGQANGTGPYYYATVEGHEADSGSMSTITEARANQIQAKYTAQTLEYVPFANYEADSQEARKAFDGAETAEQTAVAVGTVQTIGQLTYKVTGQSTAAVTSGSSAAGKLTVPSKVTIGGSGSAATFTVTEIAAGAFAGNTSLTSVKLPKSVKKIGVRAFAGCTALMKAVTGNGVTAIGNSAFKGCTALKSVTIGKKVKTIGKAAFSGCTSLKKIAVNSTVLKSVGKNAVKGIYKKAVIKVPAAKKAAYAKLFSKKTGFKATMKIK